MCSIKKATAHHQSCNLSGMAVEVATAAEVAMAFTVVEVVVTGAAVTAVMVATVVEAASVLGLAVLAGGAAAAVAAAVPEAIGAGATVIGSGALIRAPVWLTLSVALRTLSASEKRWRAN